MAGNKIGGAKAAQTNREKYGKDFYSRIGSVGGSRTKEDGAIKGFAANPELARRAGAIGGSRSKKRAA